MLGDGVGSQLSCFPVCRVLKNYLTRQKKKPNKGNFSAAQRALTEEKEEELQV